MDSELQAELDHWDKSPFNRSTGMGAIVKAARKVANLDIDAATAITYELRYIKDDDEWDDEIGDITKRAIFAALGITEGTR